MYLFCGIKEFRLVSVFCHRDAVMVWGVSLGNFSRTKFEFAFSCLIRLTPFYVDCKLIWQNDLGLNVQGVIRPNRRDIII